MTVPRTQKWHITLGDPEKGGWGGFAPAWWESTYPHYGNPNDAGDMDHVNLMNPNVLTQGPGLANLTNGTQAAAVTTLIKGILRTITSSDVSFAVGGAKLYKFSSSAVTNDADFPHTIDKAAVTGEDGEDVAYYRSKVFYSYNHSGSAGDIGMLTLASTFDDDYYSTVPTSGGALNSAPHQMVVGGDNILYIANGPQIATLDNTTANTNALDFHTDSVINSLTWNNNRVISAVNRPNVTGANQNLSAIYRWDGVKASWEGDPVEVNGRIGALYTKNGITYCWHVDNDSTGAYVLSIVSGLELVPIASFSGSLPLYYQVGEYRGHIVWISGSSVFAWGALTANVPVKLFSLSSTGHATGGGIGMPFQTPVIASNDGSNYRFAKYSGYAVTANYSSVVFTVGDEETIAVIDKVTAHIEQQTNTDALCVPTIRYDDGKSSLALTTISGAAANNTRQVIYRGSLRVEDFRMELDWATGSATNPVKIKKIKIAGHYVQNP